MAKYVLHRYATLLGFAVGQRDTDKVITSFKVVTRNPRLLRKAKVWYEPDRQCFAFAVVEPDGVTLVAAGGASGECPTLDSLIAASFEWVAWDVEIDTARKLKALELQRYETRLQSVLRQLYVVGIWIFL